MRILVISRWFPYPANNGSKIRILNLLRQLASRHLVTLVSFAEPSEGNQDSLDVLRTCCQQIVTLPSPPQDTPNCLQVLQILFSSLPRSVVTTHSIEMRRTIATLVAEQEFDQVIASELDTALYALVAKNITKIIEDVELIAYVDWLKLQKSPLKRARFWLTYSKYIRYATHLVRQFDGCTVVSDREKQELLRLAPARMKIQVIPNGVNLDEYKGHFGEPQPETLIYCGALTFYANLDAMSFFLSDIFPLILEQCPQAKLYITGKSDGVSLASLGLDHPVFKESVVLTGYLDDIRSIVAQSWVSIIPLRRGGGTRLKILESLALGTPVIATKKGAEGLDLVPGRDILIADEPVDFAAAVLSLLNNPKMRRTMSQNGQQAVIAKYNWQTIGQDFIEFVEETSSRGRQAAGAAP